MVRRTRLFVKVSKCGDGPSAAQTAKEKAFTAEGPALDLPMRGF